MNDLFLRILGIDPSQIPPDADARFEWANAPQSWGMFLLVAFIAAAVWGVFMLYRREIRTCPPRVRYALAALRAAVLILLALVLLRPTLAITTERDEEASIIILLDESQSMATRDRFRSDTDAQRAADATGDKVDDVRQKRPTRAAIVNHLLTKDNEKWLHDLTSKGHVRVHTFASRVKPLRTLPAKGDQDDQADEDDPSDADDEGSESDDDAASPKPDDGPRNWLPDEPTGTGTNLAKALRDALKQSAGGPLAAVILISEGRHTATEDDPRDAAKAIGERRVPVLAVGVGTDERPRTLRVTEAAAENAVWKGDPFEIRAAVEARGFDGDKFTVELLRRLVPQDGATAPDGDTTTGAQVVAGATQEITIEPNGDPRVDLLFKQQLEVPGRYVYTVRVTPPAGEPIDVPAQRATTVNVMSKKARVLMIAGSPTHTYQFLVPLLMRDKTIDLSCWLQSMDQNMLQEGNTPIKELPRSPTELFEYDAIIMLDPDPREFDDTWMGHLETFLSEHSGGMLYQAGPRNAARFLRLPNTRSFRNVLPVSIGDLAGADVRAILAKHNRRWPLRIIDANLDHPIMKFSDNPATNGGIWRRMPGVFWSFPVEGLKPAARDLIGHSNEALGRRNDPMPLLATGQYGPGRTVYLGFTGTWRWRRLGSDSQFFDAFWIQTVRFLVEGRLLEGKRRGDIDLSGDVVHVGDTVQVKATLYDVKYRPLNLPSVEGAWRAPDGRLTPFTLKAVPGREGEYEASVTATGVGLSELRITVPPTGGVGKPVTLARTITVEPSDAEARDVRLDRGLLKSLAEDTDGQYFEINQIDDVLAAVPKRGKKIPEPGRPIELWDTNRLLVILLVLLVIEWAFRKRYKLV